jgi:histidine triad (HIT) family protein
VFPPSSPCPFCKYLARERPYTILDRQQRTAMLVTHEQRGRGHLLVVPIAHRETILDLTAEEQSAVMADVVRASHAIVGAYDPDGVAVWQNNGIPARQSVPHVHVHVAGTVPGGSTSWGKVTRATVPETDAMAAELRLHLPQ